MLETLSQPQLDLLARKRDEWIAIGLSTQTDRLAAEKALDECYRQAGLAPPRKLWARSPFEAVKMDLELCRKPGSRGNQVCFQVWAQVENSVLVQVYVQVWAQVIDQVNSQVGDRVGSQIWEVVNSVLAQSELRSHVNNSLWFYGNQDAGLSFYDTLDELGVPDLERMRPLIALAKASGWCIPRKGFAILLDKPVELRLDGQGRLHNLDGPACRFGDGFAVHALNGKLVPAELIETPWLFSVASANEQNLMDELGMSMVNKLGKLEPNVAI